MAAESPAGGEKTESASEKRRQDFRKKGQVAQSKEVQTAAQFTIILLFWVFYMPLFWSGLTHLVASFFRNIGEFHASTSSLIALGFYIGQKFLLLLAPLLLLVMIIGFFSTYFQVGWLFTLEPLMPKFSKLNPISGMGRFFSVRSIAELVKSSLKVMVVGWVAYSTLIDKFGEALLLVDTSVSATIAFMAHTAALILAKVCGVMLLLALLDYLFVRWEMEEKMKMTKQEKKEEIKEMEGDPRVKSQIRSIQMQMARKRMMAEVPTAHVVVTNPTHIAVALRYEAEKMDAPMVIAKGTELVAMKIREIALKHDIPIIENPPVARLLHKLDLGRTIPEDLFRAVAEILAHVYALKGNRPPNRPRTGQTNEL